MEEKQLYRIKYNPEKDARFPSIRYPYSGGVTYLQALELQDSMPDPKRFIIVPDGE